MSNRTCVGCHAPVPASERRHVSANRNVWCSPECCNRHRSRVAYHADIEASRAQHREASRRKTLQKWERQGTPLRYGRCVVCDSTFVARPQEPKRVYCSKPCNIKATTRRRRESGRTTVAGGRKRGDKEVASNRRAAAKARANGTLVDRRRCKRCKVSVVARLYCEVCTLGIEKRKRARSRLKAAGRERRTKRRWACGWCRECGAAFTVLSVSPTPALPYCATCNARRHKRGRKIGKTARLRVYERDNWTCHICGDPVNRRADYGDLDEPTIDHVIAVTRGGAHHPDNWRTAHRWCNSVKGDRDLADVA